MGDKKISRRSTLKAALTAGLAAKTLAVSGNAAAAKSEAKAEDTDWSNPDLVNHIRQAERLINVERAYQYMDRYGLDGLVASIPHNIYYLSSHHGIMQWMGRHFSTYAFFPRREDAEAALIVPSSMLYHLDYKPTWVPSIIPYTSAQRGEDGKIVYGDNGDPVARPDPRFWPLREGADYKRGDKVQMALFAEFYGKTSANALYGLKDAIVASGCAKGKIGFDDPRIGPWLADVGLNGITSVDAANVFKQIRMVKTDPEIAMLREAAQRNEIALDYAIEQIEPGLPLADIERAHAKKWGELEGHGKWLIANVDGLNSGVVHKGDFMKLDSVGVYKGYHGDVGRTVSVGEPSDELARRIEANTKVSKQIYAALRPGMRFAEASQMFQDLMRQQGFDIAYAAPHPVGLEHTDMPWDVGGKGLLGDMEFADLVFENNMVFTLDMPHNEIGWGTSHVEDMIVVRKNGYEALSSGDTSLKIRPVGSAQG